MLNKKVLKDQNYQHDCLSIEHENEEGSFLTSTESYNFIRGTKKNEVSKILILEITCMT